MIDSFMTDYEHTDSSLCPYDMWYCFCDWFPVFEYFQTHQTTYYSYIQKYYVHNEEERRKENCNFVKNTLMIISYMHTTLKHMIGVNIHGDFHFDISRY